MPNEFDSLVNQAGAGNEYDAMLKDQAAEKQRLQVQGVAQSVFAGRSMNPDQAARIEKLTQETGLGDDMIQRNQDRVERDLIASSNDYDALVQKTPRFASWIAQKRTNAAMARDDMGAMGRIEDRVNEHSLMDGLLNTLGKYAFNPLQTAMDIVTNPGFGDDLGNVANAGIAGFNNQGANIAGTLYDVAAYPLNAAMKAFGSDQRITSKQVGLNVPNNAAQYYASKVSDLSDSTSEALTQGDYARAGRTLALQLVQGAPALAAAMFTGPAAPLVFGATQAAESNEQSQEAGLDPVTSLPAALAKGVIGGAVQNAFGLTNILSSWEGAMTRQYGKAISAQTMREFAKTIAYSVGGEGLAFGTQAGANDVLDYVSGLRANSLDGIGTRMVDSALMGGAMGAITLSPQAAGMAYARAHEVRRAQQTKDFYLSFGQDAAALKLRERLPEAQREFIEQATSGTGTENVYIPVEAVQSFFQSKKQLPEAGAQELGILKQYNEAVESGQDMQIPLSQWAEKAAHNDLWASLADDVKFDPAKPSLKEARDQHKETMLQVAEQARQARAADEAHADSVNFVRQDVQKQLVQNAGYSQKEANINAQLWGAFFDSLSQRTGLAPAELYNEYGLKISSNPEMQAQAEQLAVAQAVDPNRTTLNQDAQKPWQSEGVTLQERTANGRYIIEAVHPEKGVIAKADFTTNGSGTRLVPIHTAVNSEYQRQGIATAMYQQIERSNNTPIANKASHQTEAAKAFWARRDKGFGGKTVKTETKLDQSATPSILKNVDPKVLAKLEELLPRTGDKAKDDAAREALQKDPAKYKEYLATLDQLGTREERARAMGFGSRTWYHGTTVDIPEFQREALGLSTGAQSAKKGFFFASDPSTASDYAEVAREKGVIREGDRVTTKYLSDAEVKDPTSMHDAQAAMDTWRSLEYSETHNKNVRKALEEWTAFKKSKSYPNWVVQSAGREGKSVRAFIDEKLEKITSRLVDKATPEQIEVAKDQFFKTYADFAEHNPELAQKVHQIDRQSMNAENQQRLDEALKEGLDRDQSQGQNVGAYRLKGDRENIHVKNYKGESYRDTTYANEMDAATAAGKTGVLFKNTFDPGDRNNRVEQDIAAVFDPSQIRATNAAFDPRFAETANVLAQSSSDGPRAQIRFGNDRQFNIDLFKTRDSSSFAHESAHFFLEVMGDLATRDDVSQDLKDDWAATLKHLGVESRDQIGVEQHETFARSFERYLLEGKAPSASLRKAFNTFKTWLTSIYRTARSLDVELSPEIKKVFDRLLVSDEQVSRAEETMNYNSTLSTSGMSDAFRERYTDALAKARASADDQIRTKLMDDVRKVDEADYKKVQREQRDLITKELGESRDYQALDVLQGRATADTVPLLSGVTDLKLSRDSVAEIIGEDAVKEMPRGTTTKDGVHADIAAQLLGYADGKQLVESLRNKPKLKDAVEEALGQKMQELFPDYLLNPSISDDAVKAVHNENRAKVVRLEMEHLLSNDPSLAKEITRKVVGRMPREEAAKEQARIQVGDTTIKDIRPIVYQRAEVKASREAAKALAAGDIQAAFEAKRKELLNNELYRAAVEAQADVENRADGFRKLFKKNEDLAKSRDMDFVDAARATLAAHGLAQADKTPQQYLEKMQKYNPSGYEAMVALVNSALENQTGSKRDSYEAMRLEDFSAMADAVDAMWDLAKTSREQTVDGKKVDKAVAIDGLIKRLSEIPSGLESRGIREAVTDQEKRSISMLGLKARLRRVEHWAYTFDGGDINGFATKFIYRPIRDAETSLQLARIDLAKEINGLAVGLQNDTKVKIQAPELGTAFKDMNELRAALLHTGNDSNLYKLLVGRGWGHRNEDGSLDRSQWDQFIARAQREGIITKADWDFAQRTWDQFEKLKPGAQKAHKQISGFYFNEVTANGFETPYGEYKGGYVPAVVDRYLNADAQTRTDKAALEGLNNSFMFPTAGKGFTKTRVESYTAPLELNLERLPGHFDKVLKFTHMEPAVAEVGRLLQDRGLKSQFHAYDPALVSEMLIPWLQRSASQQVTTPTDGFGGAAIDKMAKLIRGNVSLQVMGFNIPNAVENLFGVLPAMTRIGPTHMTASYTEFVRSPSKMHDMVVEKSRFMEQKLAENIRDQQRDLDNLIMNPTRFDNFNEAARKFVTIPERATNHITEMVVWSGAYRQAMESGMSEADSIKTADATMRQVLTDTSPSSLSRSETGSPFVRLFTMFASWFNNQANLLGSETAVAKQYGFNTSEGFKRAFFAWGLVAFATPIAGATIKKAMKGQNLFDANEDGSYIDDALDMFVGQPVSYLTAMVPGGTVLNSVINQFNKNPFDDRINISPVISSGERLIGAPVNIYRAIETGKGQGRAIRDTLGAAGMLTGLPFSVVGKPAGYLADVEEGKARPTNPIDFTRGLVTGQPGGRAKY